MGTPPVLPCPSELRAASFLRALLEDLQALEQPLAPSWPGEVPSLRSLVEVEVLPLHPGDPPERASAAARCGLPVIPVESEEGRLVGAVLAGELAERSGSVGDVQVGGLLCPQVPAVPVGAPLAEAAGALLRSGAPALLVVEGDRLVGVVTAAALFAALRGS